MVLASMLPLGAPAHAAVAISDVRATALKDGGRIAVTWRTNVPSTGYVEYGPVFGRSLIASASEREHVEYGTEHLVVFSVPKLVTYDVTVHAIAADGSRSTASPVSVVARNGPSRYDDDADAYTANLLVRFDWDLSADELSRWAAHVREFAIRVNDMSDGWVRLGRVIIADSHAKDANWSQHCALTDCLSGADVVVFTGVGVSQYAGPARATAMWQQTARGGIAQSGSAIEFPRWLRWGGDIIEMTSQWWTGRRLAHEFGHYGMWLTDQYDGANTCENAAYDISIMNNDLWYSEIDSAATPCAWQAGGENSWDDYLRPALRRIPTRSGPPNPGPTTPGGAFELIVLDRGL